MLSGRHRVTAMKGTSQPSGTHGGSEMCFHPPCGVFSFPEPNIHLPF